MFTEAELAALRLFLTRSVPKGETELAFLESLLQKVDTELSQHRKPARRKAAG